jgi:hypothetical protein
VLRTDVVKLAICLVVFTALLAPLRRAVVDDTFIHLQYARNLAETGQLAFNRGEPTYGATSPLWVALLALFYKGGADILVWCKILSWIFGMLSIVLVFRMTIALDGRTAAPLAAALICSAEAWFVRWSAVGMETSFGVFFVLLAIYASTAAVRTGGRSAAFGIALVLAVLARPESVLLVPLAVLAVGLPRNEAKLRRFAFVPVFVVLFGLWLYFIHRHTGSYLPLTAGAKQGRPVWSAALLRSALVPVRIMGATVPLPWLALLAGLVGGALRRGFPPASAGASGSIRETPAALLLLLWVFALPASYVALDFQILSRYLVPVIPGVAVLGVIAWRRMSSRFWPGGARERYAVALLAAIVMVQSVSVYLKVVVPSTREFSSALETSIAAMGEWLKNNSSPEAVVATPDIGAIGYYSDRRVLDLGGLVSPEMNRMRETRDIEDIIEKGLYLKFHPDFLVDRSETPGRFSGKVIDGVRFIPVMTAEVPNLGIRKPKPVFYVLYRLEPAGPAAEGT